MTEEIWKDIPGYEGMYQVSSFGRVKSLERWVNNNGGKRLIKSCIRKTPKTHGYNKVCLNNKGVEVHHRVHRLVAQAFIPNTEDKLQINHIDGVKTNNCVDNLEWCTASENQYHASATGLMRIGEENYQTTLTNEDVKTIHVMHREKLCTQIKMSEIFNVSKHTINKIVRGKTWKHIH